MIQLMSQIFMALAILVFGGVLWKLGSRWLALQEREATAGEDLSDPVVAVRRGPAAQMDAEEREYRAEARRAGLTQEQIEDWLSGREPVAHI